MDKKKEKVIAIRADSEMEQKINDLKIVLDRHSTSDLVRALINWSHKNFLQKNVTTETKQM